jgi:hypothetical protein
MSEFNLVISNVHVYGNGNPHPQAGSGYNGSNVCEKEANCFTIKDIEDMYGVLPCNRSENHTVYREGNAESCWEYFTAENATVSRYNSSVTDSNPYNASGDRKEVLIRAPKHCKVDCWKSKIIRGYPHCNDPSGWDYNRTYDNDVVCWV